MRPTDLTIVEAGRALRAGDLTSVALTRAHLDRIAEANPAVRAFVALAEDRALQAAARADADFATGLDRGPMQGIPFAVKDLIDTQGLVTTYGSRLYAAHVPTRDAAVVARLLEAGAVPLGKVATYEFALVGPSFDGPHPPPVNPWNAERITGGSSSGSAAAVAAGMVRVAIGTDTGGSIRSPACYCGVVGLKPAFGRVCGDGVFPLAPGLDHVGPLAASVAEAALALDAMVGEPVAGTHLERGAAGLRIGYARAWFADDPEASPDMIEAMDAAASDLTLCGARVDLIGLPDYAVMAAAGAVILHAEALAVHRDRLRGQGDGYGRQAFQSLSAGVSLADADLARARRAKRRLRGEIDHVLERFDAVVTANALTPAPLFAMFAAGRAVWTPMRTLPFNLTGHPALAVPIGFSGGLPLGMQIIGRDEATICRIGAAYEAATDHAVARPPALASSRR